MKHHNGHMLIFITCLLAVVLASLHLIDVQTTINTKTCQLEENFATDACQVILFGHKGGY